MAASLAAVVAHLDYSSPSSVVHLAEKEKEGVRSKLDRYFRERGVAEPMQTCEED